MTDSAEEMFFKIFNRVSNNEDVNLLRIIRAIMSVMVIESPSLQKKIYIYKKLIAENLITFVFEKVKVIYEQII